MADAVNVIRAELRELRADGQDIKESAVPVQFNPETLKVSFSNQVKTDDQKGTSAALYVGKGSTKLSVQLWFDVTAPLADAHKGAGDVRELTKKVAYFITPRLYNEEKELYRPPGVRFLWGSFQFDGIMESMEESLEFFSPEGKPLRASVGINLSQQKIEFNIRDPAADQPPGAGLPGGAPPGTSPLKEALAGETMQKLAAGLGKAAEWQKIAQNNGIENPRLLRPGQLIDMSIPGLKR